MGRSFRPTRKLAGGPGKARAARRRRPRKLLTFGRNRSFRPTRKLGLFDKMKKAAKKATKAVASKAKGAACKAFGSKALDMCKAAVAAGVSKAAAAMKKQVPQINVSIATPCLKNL